jgi:hypothetical protein
VRGAVVLSGWILVLGSLIFYALAIWFLLLNRRVHIMEVRALVKKCVWVFGGVACVCMSAGILQIRSTLPPQETQMQTETMMLALLFILAGLLVPWQILHRGRRAYIARYRGAGLLPAVVVLLVIDSVAVAVTLLSMGILGVLLVLTVLTVQLSLAYVLPFFVVAATAGVIAMGTSVVLLLLWRKLEADTEMEITISGSEGGKEQAGG